MRPWFLVSFVAISPLLQAQDYPREDLDPAHLVDEILATQDLDLNYQDLYENFLQLISNPLDLNSVTDEQLRALYILSQEEINAILSHRAETGPFISVYELQTLFDYTIFIKLIPFVTVPDLTQSFNSNILERIAAEQNNYLLLRWGKTLEPQQGYSEKASPSNRYTGSPDNFYARFRTSRAGDFSLGFTVKKDAGEAVVWNPSKKQYGFDYLSFHLQTINKGKVKNLILGDYQAQFGQGLTLGSVFGIGKNGEAVNTMRRANLGFIPYTSIYEAGYFRGFAISYSPGKFITLHTMISVRGRDGALQQDTISDTADYLSSFSFTGLHRTAAELANRNAVTEVNGASVLQFKNHFLDAGLILHHTRFSVPLSRTPSLYNQFEFDGDRNSNVGGYLNYNFSNYSFFSEFSQSLGQGRSLVGGILTSVTSKLDVSLLFRSFDRNFHSFYANAISENSTSQNERGMYWGWKYSFNKKYSLAGYTDIFSFPWLKYRSYAPSGGNEWLARFNYRPSKSVSVFLQVREESKQRNTGVDNNLYLTDMGVKRNYWINCDYAANPRLNFRTRVQFSSYAIAGTTTRGMVLLQDITYAFGRFSVTGRYALFDTDNYDNRLYVYERDAWLSFTFPAYNGKGVRNYLLIHCRLSRKTDVWFRWGHTRYPGVELIGAGGDAIRGDTRNDVKLQARFRF